MSNYTKSTNFATKDNLTPGDPLKIVRGTEIDTEFNNIATAIATKTDNASAAITGGSITGITDLAIADGGTGASTATAAINNLLPSQTSNANKYLQTDGTNVSWDAVSLSTADITGTLPVANGGTGVTSSTGTGSVVLSNSPTLVTPALGTPASATLTNATGLPISTGVSGLGTGVATFLATPSSANLASAVSDETGSGALVFANSPTLVTPALGTPSSATLTNATGLPISTGVSGLGTGVATALAVNVGSAGAPVVNGGALGTPSSGTVTNLTGTASININGTVGATTPTTGAFTTVAASSSVTLSGGTANGVTYLNGSKVLTSGSALTFDGTSFFGGTNIYASGRFYAQRSSSSLNLPIAGYTDGSAGAVLSGTKGDIVAFGNAGGDGVIFANSNTEAMRLTLTGLGIGTSSPSQKLHVIGASLVGDTTNGYVKSYVDSVKSYLQSLNVAQNAYRPLNLMGSTVGFENGSGNTLLFDTAGNLGLGVTPSAWSSLFIATQLGTSVSLVGRTAANVMYLNNNAYVNSSNNDTYINTGFAAQYIQSSSGQHLWNVAPSGTAGNAISFTQAMTLTSDGNLGLGTTSPNISGGASGSQVMTISGSSSGRNALIELKGTRTSADQVSSYIRSFSNSGATPGVDLQFYRGATDTDGYLTISTSGTERATITSGGYFKASNTGSYIASGSGYHELVTNAADWILYSRNSNASPSGIHVNHTTDSNGTGNLFLNCTATAGETQRAAIRSNGGLANYSANNVNLSDVRTKTDIQDAGGYLAKICAIPVRTFKYKDQTDELLNLGCIAQEVEAVAPELVDISGFGETPEDGVPLKAIYQTDLQYALMKCIQEQQAIIESLKARLDAANL